MKDGFIKVACVTPRSKVADVSYNVSEIISSLDQVFETSAKIAVFPELSVTGYTSGDLFYHPVLLNAAFDGMLDIARATLGKSCLVFIGLPFSHCGKIFNVAAVLFDGQVIALIPKTHLPNYNEFYEKRQFSPGFKTPIYVDILNKKVPFGVDILLSCVEIPELKVAAEICEDLWVMSPPSVAHAQAGATVIVNLSASNEVVGKLEYRRSLVSMQSAKLFSAYLYADAGIGESTTDLVFAGHNLIAENGKLLAESELFDTSFIVSEIDVKFLYTERTKFSDEPDISQSYLTVPFSLATEKTLLTRRYSPSPFIPDDSMQNRAELILSLQSHALARRLEHTHSKSAVIGISGGLDSALALLVAVRAKKLLPDDIRKDFCVYGITMPCFGTTDRTLKNAKRLTTLLGAKCVKISIRTAVNRHLADIKHAKNAFDVTYENAQARERTQVLMDFANDKNGLVIGTGDLSELALGWATYNGDHMSMYGVNCSVPKTLVKYLVIYEAQKYGGEISKTLTDIYDTPISPELLPSDGKTTVQITEDKVGPYELHDFFLYYFVRTLFSPSKIYRLALYVFDGKYSPETIKKWLVVFLKRFFAQQFKRSCIPDGVKVGSVSLSPRGDLRMPSDASVTEWLNDLSSYETPESK